MLTSGLILSLSLAAQSIGGVWSPTASPTPGIAGQQFGSAAAAVGDVNGNGAGDYALVSQAELRVYDGATNALLYAVPTSSVGVHAVGGAGDVNGDGKGDIVLGSPAAAGGAGTVEVINGAIGVTLWLVTGAAGDQLGFAVDTAGDQNGNTVADVVAGAPAGIGVPGKALVLDGVTGSILHTFTGAVNSSGFGHAVAGGFDADGDGLSDIVVGAPYEKIGTAVNSGDVYWYSGASGHPLIRSTAGTQNAFLGKNLARAGDMNGDGYGDLLISRDTNSSHDSAIRAYNGRNGNIFYAAEIPEIGAHEPGMLAGGGHDLDGDGVPEFAVGIPMLDAGGATDVGSVRVFDGRTGSLMREFFGSVAGDRFGDSVAIPNKAVALGVQGGFVAGAPGAAGSDGRAEAWSFSPCLFLSSRSFTAGVANNLQAAFDFPSAAAGYTYRLLMSGSLGLTVHNGLKIPLATDAILLASSTGNYPAGLTVMNGGGALNGAGNAVGSIQTIPVPAVYIGRSLGMAVVAGPSLANITLSSIGILVTVVP